MANNFDKTFTRMCQVSSIDEMYKYANDSFSKVPLTGDLATDFERLGYHNKFLLNVAHYTKVEALWNTPITSAHSHKILSIGTLLEYQTWAREYKSKIESDINSEMAHYLAYVKSLGEKEKIK